MNSLQVFNFKQNEVRTILKDGEPWFVAKDVADILGFRDPYTATRNLDEDEKLLHTLCVSGQNRQTTLVNEPGLYSLILRSNKPEAKEFKRWITHEVIPSIRKHGAYMTPETLEKTLTDPDFIIKLATELKNEKQARIQAEKTVKIMKPKALFADSVSDSDSLILIGGLAKILKQNGVDIGQRRLFQWMRDNGYLIKRHGTDYNMPTQRSMELGLFRIKETAVTHSSGFITVSRTPKVTGKGQVYFVNKFIKDGVPV